MELDEMNQTLNDALAQVLEKDLYLLEHKIHERAIAHRLAVYLEPHFPEYNLDCEYDGNIDADSGKKYIQILRSKAIELGMLKKGEEERDFVYRCVIPDIIIHRRGFNGIENNLLIVEIKKSANPSDGAWDAEKLSRFTSSEFGNSFEYRYGAFVKFTLGEKPDFSIEWYQHGEKM